MSRLYENLTKEMLLISETKQKIKDLQKPYLIFEGKTDNKFFRLSYEALYNEKIEAGFTLCEHIINNTGSSIGSGANFINQFMHNHISKTPTNNVVVGIFDYDSTGFSEITALKASFDKLDTATDAFLLYRHKTKNNVFVMTLVAPSHRNHFIHKTIKDYCYLSTELLLEDSVIPAANRQFPSPFDQTVYSFTGGKDNFVDLIESNKASINFEGFRPTFELIERIINTGR